MSPASLPAAPRLEQLRKQAKQLLRAHRAHRAGDAAATARIAAQVDRPTPPKLADAQFAIAREHGFADWPRLRAYVERAAAHGPALQHAFHEDVDYYEGRASGLLASAEDGTDDALAAFARHALPLTADGARAAIARRHGFSDWSALRLHVAALREAGEPFARAYRAVEARDPEALAALLDRFPELVDARGTNDNDLLGMATATGDERLLRVLLGRGADPDRANAHGWTALHQAAYLGAVPLVRILLDAGAPVARSARGDGGTPLIVALFWGHREAAQLLAEHGLAPGNLRAAAGLGRLDLLDALFGEDGRPQPAAGARRGFYRPHGGFPRWSASDADDEVRDEALAWAARNDRVEAIERLASLGADLDADVYRGTALVWAAAGGRVAAIERLLALGADPNRRASFGGADHGEGVTALHLAAQYGQVGAIDALLRGGADPTLRDALHDATAAEWAAFGEQPAAAARLRNRASAARRPPA